MKAKKGTSSVKSLLAKGGLTALGLCVGASAFAEPARSVRSGIERQNIGTPQLREYPEQIAIAKLKKIESAQLIKLLEAPEEFTKANPAILAGVDTSDAEQMRKLLNSIKVELIERIVGVEAQSDPQVIWAMPNPNKGAIE